MDNMPQLGETCPEHDADQSTETPQLPGDEQRPERLLGGPNCS